jgi:hypothetical protein
MSEEEIATLRKAASALASSAGLAGNTAFVSGGVKG